MPDAKSHTDREYSQQLDQLREGLLRMAGRVERMIADSVVAVRDRNVELARATIYSDNAVNRAEKEVDDLCLRILARWQPMASDLRFVTLALKMVTDIERIGDLAVNVCERAIDLEHEPVRFSYETISELAGIAQAMIHDAIDSFVNGSAEQARAVIDRDDSVDDLYEKTFLTTFEIMRAEPDTLGRGIHFLSVAKWLERMGDHATNIAEQVVFMIEAKDIRHAGKLGERKGKPA